MRRPRCVSEGGRFISSEIRVSSQPSCSFLPLSWRLVCHYLYWFQRFTKKPCGHSTSLMFRQPGEQWRVPGRQRESTPTLRSCPPSLSLPRTRQIMIATTRVSRSTTRFPFPLWTLFMAPTRGSSWESGMVAAHSGRNDHRI